MSTFGKSGHFFVIPCNNSSLYNINRFVLQELGNVVEVSDCEELVGVTYRRWWGWSFRFVNSHVYTLWNIWFY